MAFRQSETFASKEAGLVRRALEMSGKWNALCNDQIVINANNDPDATTGTYAQLAEVLGSQGKLAVSAIWTEAFDAFFAANPRYAKNDANQNILEQAWAQSGRPLTAANVEIAADPDVCARLAVRPEYEAHERAQRAAAERAEGERIESEKYRAEMLNWSETLQQSLFAKGRINTYERDRSMRDEKRRLDGMDYQSLASEYTRRKEVRRAQTMDAKTYRAEVAAKNNQPTQEQQRIEPKSGYSQYEKLPEVYVSRNGLSIPMTRKGLIELANRDSFSFREVVRRFGAESVNDILAGRI